MFLSDIVCPEITEAIQLFNLSVDESDSYFLRLKSHKNTIRIFLNSTYANNEYSIEINELEMQTDVPLELINEVIIISLS